MINKSISIFGSKILLEIVKEIKLLSNFEFNYYTDLNSCLNESENKLLIIFLDKESKYNYSLMNPKEWKIEHLTIEGYE